MARVRSRAEEETRGVRKDRVRGTARARLRQMAFEVGVAVGGLGGLNARALAGSIFRAAWKTRVRRPDLRDYRQRQHRHDRPAAAMKFFMDASPLRLRRGAVRRMDGLPLSPPGIPVL